MTDESQEILRVLLEVPQSAGKETPSAEKDGTTQFVPDRLRSDMQPLATRLRRWISFRGRTFQNPEKQGARS